MASATPTPALTLRLAVDTASRRVLFAETSEDAVAFLSTLLATPVHAAVEMLLQEDPPSAAAGCFGNLASAAGPPLQPPPRAAAASSSSSSSTAPPVSSTSARLTSGMRLYRCEHLRCPCSDAVSRAAGSPCPCASCGPGSATRSTELHFLETVFFRRADGSSFAAASGRGGGRGGDTFYRCRARNERQGRDVFLRRGRVTDERGVVCPLCHSCTNLTVRLVQADEEGSSTSATRTAPGLGYAIMDDLAVRNMAGEGSLTRATLLAELGVVEDPAAVREEVVPLGYKQVHPRLCSCSTYYCCFH